MGEGFDLHGVIRQPDRPIDEMPRRLAFQTPADRGALRLALDDHMSPSIDDFDREGGWCGGWLLRSAVPEVPSHHVALGVESEIASVLHPCRQRRAEGGDSRFVRRVGDEIPDFMWIRGGVVELLLGFGLIHHLPLVRGRVAGGSEGMDVGHHRHIFGVGDVVEPRPLGHEVPHVAVPPIGDGPRAIQDGIHSISMDEGKSGSWFGILAGEGGAGHPGRWTNATDGKGGGAKSTNETTRSSIPRRFIVAGHRMISGIRVPES